MSITANLIDFFQQYVKKHSLIASQLADYYKKNPEAPPLTLRVLVAVSGGADSTALLHALANLSGTEFHPTIKLEIEAAHLNHSIRDEAADADAAYVQELCANLGVKLHLLKYDVPSYAAEHSLSLEEAARKVRYSFFAKIISEHKLDLLLTAHTANDQAETVLMHLLRGSGLTGLTGIYSVTFLAPLDEKIWKLSKEASQYLASIPLLRPLLKVWREEIEAYCTEHGLKPRHDETNDDQTYFRNRIRHSLLPLLEQDYQSGVKQNLVRMADILQDDEAWLAELTEISYKQYSRHYSYPLEVEFPTGWLSQQPLALQKRLLRYAYNQFNGSLAGLEQQHLVEPLQQIAKQAAFGSLTLPNGLIIEGNAQTVAIIAKEDLEDLEPNREKKLVIASDTTWGDWEISTEILTSTPIAPDFSNPYQALLDYDLVGEDLAIRGRRAGERVRLYGAPGRRKLQDIMLDARILPSLRDIHPIIVRPAQGEGQTDEIVWIPGINIAHDFALTDKTTRLLKITCQRV